MKNSQYSIKDLENLTNIKAHTIRIWEQRYALLQPKRTATNIRYYEDEDLKKILNINLLYTNGLKISKIAALSESEIVAQTKILIEDKHAAESNEIDVLLMSILDLNAEKIDEILENSLATNSIEDFFSDTLNPLLSKIGDLWQLNSISIGHEHFFSNLLRAFLLSKTRELKPKKSKNATVLLFLPPQEEHELGLLIYQYIFKREGWRVIFLGHRIPYDDLQLAYNQLKPDLAITSLITNISEKECTSILENITNIIPKEKLAVSGIMATTYQHLIPKQVRLITSKKELADLTV